MSTNISMLPSSSVEASSKVTSTGAIEKKVKQGSPLTPGEELYFEQDRLHELVAQAEKNGRNMSDREIYDEIRNQVWKESDERYLAKAKALVEKAKEVLVPDCSSCHGYTGCIRLHEQRGCIRLHEQLGVGAPGGGAAGGGGGSGSS